MVELQKNKTSARDALKAKFSLAKRSKIIVLIENFDGSFTDMIQGLSYLPADFIVLGKWETQKNVVMQQDQTDIDMQWIDAIITQDEDTKLEELMKIWVVPITRENNYLWKVLQEFNPGRAEGNAYLFEESSSWSAYYALVRYLENHKFPYDNRNLVKNVCEI